MKRWLPIARVLDRHMTRSGWAVVAVIALGLGACASGPPAPVVDLSESDHESAPPKTVSKALATSPGTYRVVRGDTLYAIAFRHGLDFRDVAAWNNIAPPYRIYAGQDLRLDAPGANHSPTPVAAPATPPRPVPPPATPTMAGTAPLPAPSTPGMFEDVPPPTAPVATSKPPAVTGQTPDSSTASPAPAAAQKPPVQELSPRPAAPPEAAQKPPVTEMAPSPRIADDSVVTSANGVTWRWPGKGSLVGTFVAGDQTRQGIDVAGKAGDPVLAAADGEVVYSGNGLLGYGELIIVKHNANFLSAYGHNRKRLVQEGDKVKGGQQIAEMGSSASSRDELHFEIRKNGKPVNPLDYLPAR
jgi:lipoprotein NlpD